MDLLNRLDELLFQVEKRLVWIVLLLMGTVMFLSVAHRAASAMDNPRSAPDFVLQAVGEGGWPLVASLGMTLLVGVVGDWRLRRASNRVRCWVAFWLVWEPAVQAGFS